MNVMGEQQGEASIRSLFWELGHFGSNRIGVYLRVQPLAWLQL
jgi:hypothetical protein